MVGKRGGGKELGISLNFATPEEFFAYLDKQCAHCSECDKHEYKNNLVETGTNFKGRTRYLCLDCFSE